MQILVDKSIEVERLRKALASIGALEEICANFYHLKPALLPETKEQTRERIEAMAKAARIGGGAA